MFSSKVTPLILTSVVALSAAASENDLSYNYATLGYVQGEVVDEDFSGYQADVSVGVSKNFFLTGNYSLLESDDKFFGDEIDATLYTLGAGYHTPIMESVDFVTSLSYSYAEVETSGFKEDGDGYLLEAGVRAMPTKILELAASINYEEIDDDGDTGFSLGARVFAAPKVSIGLSYDYVEDVDVFGVDARFNF